MSYLGQSILNMLFNGQPFTPPSQLFLGLHTASGEVSGGGYARQDVTDAFGVALGGVASNAQRISMSSPAVAWGEVVGMSLVDGAGADANTLFYGAFETPFPTPAGTGIFFEPGVISFELKSFGDIADDLLNMLLRRETFQQPEYLYLALMTDAGEVVGGGYERTSVGGKFALASAEDTVSNAQQINAVRPSLGWGTINGGAILDAAAGGRRIIGGNLQKPFTAPPNQDIFFLPGVLNFGITVRA